MLKLNFDFSKFVPVDDKPTLKSSSSTKKGGFGRVLGLGDAERIASLPDQVDEDFINDYQEGLDRFFTKYVTSGQLTITEATKYKEYIFGMVFGTHEHLGLFQFIRAKSPGVHANEREMITTAEDFLMRGWRINKDEAGRWWIIDTDLNQVLDVTGATDISEAAATKVFSPDTAHVFLSDEVASRVAALAKRSGFDADSLVSMGQLDLLLSATDNKEIAGYLLNYNTLRFVLKKSGKYHTNSTDTSFNSLYEDGYRIGSQIFYPTLSKVILEKRNSQILATPVDSTLHPDLGLNVSALSVIASDIRQQLYKGKVSPQILDEVTEFGQTIALMTEFWTTDAVRISATELHDILHRLDYNYRAGELSEKHYAAVRQSLAEVLITEVALLGNDRFSLGSFGYDTVGGKIFVYAGDNLFNYTAGGDFESLGSYGREFFQRCIKNNFSPDFVEGNLDVLLGYASEGFRTRLRGVKADTDRFGAHTYERVDVLVSQRVSRILDAIH